MFRYWITALFFSLANFAHAADTDVIWYFQSFPDVSRVMAIDANPQAVISDLCRAKAKTDLTNVHPDSIGGDTAFGHNLAGLASTSKVDDGMWQCIYASATPKDDNLYFLHVVAETKCDDGSEFDRVSGTCVKSVQCEEGQTSLLAGFSSAVVQTAPGTVYIADQTPESTCKKVTGSSIACTYKKPAYSHSCYSDSPLSWDGNGNLSGSATGHCNYQFVNTGDKCTLTSSNTLPDAWGGYSLKAASGDGYTCADGITTPGCPDGSTEGGSGSGDSGSGGSGSSGGSAGGSGGGSSSGDDSGSGSDTGSGTGSGGSDAGSGGTVSGTACSAALTCTGDAVQCAILAQQKKTACALADLTQVDQGEIGNMLSGEKFQLEEKTVEATSLFDRSRFLPSACPAPESITFSFGTYLLPYDLLCDFAEKFSYLIVLMATFFAMLIVFRD